MRSSARSLVAVIFFFISATLVHADTVYSFDGTITLTGPSIVETINVSFDFQWENVGPPTNPGTVSNLLVTSNGPLNFSGAFGDGPMSLSSGFPYSPLLDGQGDEIDIKNLSGFSFVNDSIPPTISAQVYSCSSAACLADFDPGFACAYGVCGTPFPITSTFVELPIDAPESSTLMFLFCGLVITIVFNFLRTGRVSEFRRAFPKPGNRTWL